jgi:hypothetical protein
MDKQALDDTAGRWRFWFFQISHQKFHHSATSHRSPPQSTKLYQAIFQGDKKRPEQPKKHGQHKNYGTGYQGAFIIVVLDKRNCHGNPQTHIHLSGGDTEKKYKDFHNTSPKSLSG